MGVGTLQIFTVGITFLIDSPDDFQQMYVSPPKLSWIVTVISIPSPEMCYTSCNTVLFSLHCQRNQSIIDVK